MKLLDLTISLVEGTKSLITGLAPVVAFLWLLTLLPTGQGGWAFISLVALVAMRFELNKQEVKELFSPIK